jgi:hypothetical protein
LSTSKYNKASATKTNLKKKEQEEEEDGTNSGLDELVSVRVGTDRKGDSAS